MAKKLPGTSSKPKYQELMDSLSRDILSGRFKPGQKMPSEAALVKKSEPLLGVCFEFCYLAIFNRFGWTGFGTGGYHAIFHAVITERTFVRPVVAIFVASDYTKWAGDDAVAAAVTNILLHVDGIELGTNNGSGGTRLLAGGVGTVFADIATHEPAVGVEKRQSGSRRCLRNSAIALCVTDAALKEGYRWDGWAFLTDVFDELHVSPGDGTQLTGIIVA